MRFLDLVEQYDRVGLPPHGFGQLTAFVVTDVSRRRSDQPRYAVPFLILAHVDTSHHRVVVEQVFGQRFGQLGLADAGRAQKDERSDRPARILQPGPRTPHGVRNGRDRLILSDYPVVQLALHLQQLLTFALQHPADRNARPAGDHFGDVLRIDLLFDHRPGLGVFVHFGLQFLNLGLRLAHFAVTDLGHAAVVAVAFGFGGLNLQIVEHLFVLLYLL